MKQEMNQISSTIDAAEAFIEPEILKIDRATIESFLKQEKKLEVYRHYLDDILRRQAHTGSEGEEKIIADAGLMADAPESIFNVFSNAEFPYPELVLSDGNKVKLDQAGFESLPGIRKSRRPEKSVCHDRSDEPVPAGRMAQSSRQR